jgi:hypothetical protein
VLRRVAVLAVAVVGVVGGAAGVTEALRATTGVTSAEATGRFLAARIERDDAVEAVVERRAASYPRGCAATVAKAPRGKDFDALNDDALVSLTVATYRRSAGILMRYGRMTERLSWPKAPRLTSLVREIGREELGLARVVSFDVCAVFAEWARSGYRAVPAVARRFEREVRALAGRRATRCGPVAPNEHAICSFGSAHPDALMTVWRLLTRHEDRNQRELADEIVEREARAQVRVRAFLSASALRLTQQVGLDRFALRLFIESLRDS